MGMSRAGWYQRASWTRTAAMTVVVLPSVAAAPTDPVMAIVVVYVCHYGVDNWTDTIRVAMPVRRDVN